MSKIVENVKKKISLLNTVKNKAFDDIEIRLLYSVLDQNITLDCPLLVIQWKHSRAMHHY